MNPHGKCSCETINRFHIGDKIRVVYAQTFTNLIACEGVVTWIDAYEDRVTVRLQTPDRIYPTTQKIFQPQCLRRL